jgi:DNA-binding NarL/FixJ family response regulator
VLVVDDHRGVLDSVSAMLAAHFDVVGAAVSGEEALEIARQVDPDLVVLDITMPGLDGFQTFRALRAGGSRAQAVFLSMHGADDYVREAFACGGRGFVVKTRIGPDLASALDQVLAGRQFVPSLTSLLELADGRAGHAMQIHDDEASFLNGLAAFYDVTLRRGDGACVIATERIREGLGERLRIRGWNVGGSSGDPRYRAVDAADALNRFMRDGLPDVAALAEIAGELDEYRLAVAKGSTSRLAIFGNMVSLLIMAGNARAAIALEHTWNTLTRDLPFFTLCGYSTACFAGETQPELFQGACAEHSAVSHAQGV